MLPLNIFLSWPAASRIAAPRGSRRHGASRRLGAASGRERPGVGRAWCDDRPSFINELVKNAATGSETAGEKMKALAMHLLEAQGWERVKDIRESLTEPMLTSAITPRWGSLMSARL